MLLFNMKIRCNSIYFYPSPVHSLREFTTSPTRGEVFLPYALTFFLSKSKKKSYALRIPLPLWERSSFCEAKGWVRGFLSKLKTQLELENE